MGNRGERAQVTKDGGLAAFGDGREFVGFANSDLRTVNCELRPPLPSALCHLSSVL